MAQQNENVKNGRLGHFWAVWWGWVVVGLILFAVVIVLIVLSSAGVVETGLDEYTPPAPDTQRAKTLWDWMDLVLVPLVLALAAAFFTRVTDKRAREIEDNRIKEQQRIELDRSRDATLQTYLDRVSALLRSKWRESGESFIEANIIRAQTLTILRQLDGERKGLLLQFLYDLGLIGGLAIHIGRENQQYRALIDLTAADLGWVNLRWANLRGLGLRNACLHRANLYRAKLEEADLSWAYLYGADLRRANLRGAYLYGADLRRANLRGANLYRANLVAAKVTKEQLDEARTLIGAALPDGTEYTDEAEPEPTPTKPEPQDTEGQPDQLGDLDASEGDHDGPTRSPG